MNITQPQFAFLLVHALMRMSRPKTADDRNRT
jgi:hypothetical protein